MALTEGAISPDLFRQWSAISLVAGAMQRRVWIKMGPRITFPNLYILLVAHPGVGKYTIEVVRELWTQTSEPGTGVPMFKVAPDSMSKASMMDTIVRAKSIFFPPAGPPITTHSLLVAAEEIGVFLPAYDLEFIGALNSIYNNKPLHEEVRRTGSVKELKIEFPQLNILAGAQPGWLASVFPEEAWSTGLASRLIMIYAADGPIKDLFDDPGEPEALRKQVLSKLGHMSEMYGQMKWQPAAAKRVGDWHMAKGPPAPTHSKLEHYNRRRTSLHMPKLAMVSAVARTGGMVIEETDVARAIFWLTEAEKLMPDIFRSMVGKSDAQVMEECHFYITSEWARKKQTPVDGRTIHFFLAQRVPSDKVQKIMEIMERSGMIERIASTDTYNPRPKKDFAVE